MPKRVVLAYSGGLDTSVAVRWMIENYGVEVIALAVNVGQDGGRIDEAALVERAQAAGAVEAEVVDARAEFAADYLVPALKANALYEGRYPLVSALSRPVIAQHLVAAAARHGADAVAHGCTGKGNDQVRFEVSTRALNPDLEVLAPVRVWGMTRDDSIHYAYDHGIPITATKEKVYSIDDNLWGRAIECGEMEDPWNRPPVGVWSLTKQTASTPRDLTIAFAAGVPVAVDDEPMDLVPLIEHVGAVVGSYGWGRLDMVENRRVGIKSRETYECPSGLALIVAHQDLESICHERDLAREKQRLEIRYAELVYDGLWFSPLRHALDAFIDETQRFVTGEVRLHLEPGSLQLTGRRAPRSLYDYSLATYDAADNFRHEDSAGFVRLWGLSTERWSAVQGPGST
jgi:argininosuccinate synthase